MSLEVVKTQSSRSLQLNEQFKMAAQKVCVMLAAEGIYRKPYIEGLPYFSVLADDQKAEIVRSLTFFAELCQEQVSEGYKLKDNLSFTWRAFKKLGLIPRADIFNHLTDDDIVEIYSSENRQLYRNFKFFEFCSYTFEELHSLEWWSLFERESAKTMEIFDAVSKVISGEVTGTYFPPIEPHLLKEIRSADCLSMTYEVKLVSPLVKNKQVDAFIIFERATLAPN